MEGRYERLGEVLVPPLGSNKKQTLPFSEALQKNNETELTRLIQACSGKTFNTGH